MSIFNDFYKKLVFLGGDIRKINCFPWITWDVHQHKVKFEELLEALPLTQFGDIGIHRDDGYLSNIVIPGFMKHAWIHTNDGKNPMIVEAISEGVTNRSALYPMYSDYTIILRPKNIDYKSRKGACKKANAIVGTRYDHDFKFDIERELEFYKGEDLELAKEDLGSGVEYMKKFDLAFSCTEVVGYSWWHEREKLRIYRTKNRGKNVILADSFLNNSWEIIWMSSSVTLKSAVNFGLHEEAIEMIKNYLL